MRLAWRADLFAVQKHGLVPAVDGPAFDLSLDLLAVEKLGLLEPEPELLVVLSPAMNGAVGDTPTRNTTPGFA